MPSLPKSMIENTSAAARQNPFSQYTEKGLSCNDILLKKPFDSIAF